MSLIPPFNQQSPFDSSRERIPISFSPFITLEDAFYVDIVFEIMEE